jgi:hypothetical protein
LNLQTFAFDFEYTSPDGFSLASDFGNDNHPPTALQLAFAYTTIVNDESTGFKTLAVRRLRITTVQIQIAASVSNVYMGADSAVITSLMTQKALDACRDYGITEVRVALFRFSQSIFSFTCLFAGSTVDARLAGYFDHMLCQCH